MNTPTEQRTRYRYTLTIDSPTAGITVREFDRLDTRTRYLDDYLRVAFSDVIVGATDELVGMAEVGGSTISWGVAR